MAVRYAVPPIITDGLVLYLDAANRQSYVSGSTTWYDAAGSGISGSLINGPTFSPDNAGSIVFDRVDDYIQLPASNGFNISTDVSLEIWFKTTDTFGNSDSSTAGRIINLHSGNPGTNVSILVGSDGLGFYNTRTGFYSDNTNISTGLWIHGVAVFSGVNSKLYRNSQLAINVNVGESIQTFSSYPLQIGVFDGGGVSANANSRFFGGELAIAKIYNRALTSQEVLQNYNSTKARFGL